MSIKNVFHQIVENSGRTVSLIAAVHGPSLSMFHDGKSIFDEYKLARKQYIELAQNTVQIVDQHFSHNKPSGGASVLGSKTYVLDDLSNFDLSNEEDRNTAAFMVGHLFGEVFRDTEGDIVIAVSPEYLSLFVPLINQFIFLVAHDDKGNSGEIVDFLINFEGFELADGEIPEFKENGKRISMETMIRIEDEDPIHELQEEDEDCLIQEFSNDRQWVTLRGGEIVNIDKVEAIFPTSGNQVKLLLESGRHLCFQLEEGENAEDMTKRMFQKMNPSPFPLGYSADMNLETPFGSISLQ